MSWLVPRPASLNDTVSDPLLFRLPLALTKCSFCANAGTAYASTIASAAASSITFLNIKGFLLFLGRPLLPFSKYIQGCVYPFVLGVVECLFAGAGRSCVSPYIAKQASGPLSL